MTPHRLAFVAVLATAFVLPSGLRAARANDENIAKDFKENGKKGRPAAKERAEFWEKKSVTGPDLYWLARFWDEAAEDDKAVGIYEEYLKVPPDPEKKNSREPALWNIVGIHAKKRRWKEVLETADRFQKMFPESAVKNESFDKQGRAHRMLGDAEKATAAFTEAANQGLVSGVVDLADMQVSAGKVDDAKATLTKYMAEFEAQPLKQRGMKSLATVKEMYEVIGKPAPALDTATSVGREDAPKDWKGKPSVLFFWHMSWAGTDVTLQLGKQFQQAFGDTARIMGVSTFNKYNPLTRKVEQELPPEEEAKLWKRYLDESPNGAPPYAIVVTPEAKTAFGLDQPGQLVVVDGEGVIRYVRPADPTDLMYPWLNVQDFVNKTIK